ncbi:MAG: EutN/CcmL family microcompartment protein [Candidatus Humimicrobiaceae bacterium]
MLIGEIIGTVVSTIKVSKIENARLKIVKIIDPFGKATGKYFIVEDGVGVGIGEKVLIADDDGVVKKLLRKENIPIRSAVVAKIDKINIYE